MSSTTKRPARRRSRRRDWGRAAAIALCAVFAFIGAVPMALGVLVRTVRVRAWAARETAALLKRELDVGARYDLHVVAWPPTLSLTNVEVGASDGGSPFLAVERIAVRPRLFSLLAGKLDAGDIEVVGPRIRAVIEKGEIKNLHFTVPKTGSSSSSQSPPLASLAITDARIDLTFDGSQVSAREIDVDLSVEEDGAMEVSLRAGESTVTRTHPFVGREATEDAVDDDVICHLEARARIQGKDVLVRRLSLKGSADVDPDPGTRPSCNLRDTDWRAVELRLGALRLAIPEKGAPRMSGRVSARLPTALVHRFVDMATTSGSVSVDLEVEYDGKEQLPRVRGHVGADMPGLDGRVFSKRIDLDVDTADRIVHVTNVLAFWADGRITIPDLTIRPFDPGIPIETGPIGVDEVELPGLLRDLATHPQAHVGWTLEKGKFDYLHGHLNPLLIEGPLSVATRNFEIFTRPTVDPLRAHMMGVKEALVHGTFVINGASNPTYRLPAVVLSNFSVETPRSRLRTTVTLGFGGTLGLEVYDGSTVNLEEISPLSEIPLSGKATLRVSGGGPYDFPKIAGEIRVGDFVFGGLRVGDVEVPKVAFQPLVLDLESARIHHGRSLVRSSLTRIAFDKGADVVVDADLDTREPPSLGVRDLFDVFHLEKDPRLAGLDGIAAGKGRLHYAMGGREDVCGGGFLHVETSMDINSATLLDEHYDGGTIDADLVWDDQRAGTSGLNLDVRSMALRKGEGSLLLGATVRHGGILEGNVIGHGLPLAKIDMLGGYGKVFDGTASLVGRIFGTVAAPEASIDINVSRVRSGATSLGPSQLHVGLTAAPVAEGVTSRANRTRCGNPKVQPFDANQLDRDISEGDIRMDGALFDGRIVLDHVGLTRQRHKVMTGTVSAKNLDLGTLTSLAPEATFTGSPPRGSVSATLRVKSLPFDAPQHAELGLTLLGMDLSRDNLSVRLANPMAPIELTRDELRIPEGRLLVRTGSGPSATVLASGVVHRATTAPDVDASLRVEPMDLGHLGSDVSSIEHSGGTLTGALRVLGPLQTLRYTGSAKIAKGELKLKGVPLGLTDVNADVDIADGDARVRKATAQVGGGTVEVIGRMPLRGPEAFDFSANIAARGVKVPVTDGVNLTADADLTASYRSTSLTGQRSLPNIEGLVTLSSFSYTRPIALNLNLAQFGRAPRTTVDTYDPANDLVRFKVRLVSPRPLRFHNNLVEMDLEVMNNGLVLSGTNQRFGALGEFRILPDSKLALRSNEFVVREGYVRFNDPLKIVPKVDVRAQTEYRRFATTQGQDQPAAGTPAPDTSGASAAGSGSTATGAASTANGGVWRITLHAHGDVDDLKVSLSSDPPLSQEDIVLLLTIGMTRAELDRGAASALGSTMGLEALSALTGADKAVKTIVPIIDEFRFGTGYSPKTARSEPTVTVGKRLSDSVRTTLTTGVSEDREVRGNVEVRLNRRLSVQGSYDNLNDVTQSPLGNIGVDLRWRIEFE